MLGCLQKIQKWSAFVPLNPGIQIQQQNLAKPSCTQYGDGISELHAKSHRPELK
jgi:hypothetical protein